MNATFALRAAVRLRQKVIPYDKAVRKLEDLKLRLEQGRMQSSTGKSVEALQAQTKVNRIQGLRQVTKAEQSKFFRLLKETGDELKKQMDILDRIGADDSGKTAFALYVAKQRKLRRRPGTINDLIESWRNLSDEGRASFLRSANRVSNTELRDKQMKDLRPKEAASSFAQFASVQLPVLFSKHKERHPPKKALELAKSDVTRLYTKRQTERAEREAQVQNTLLEEEDL